MRQFTNHSVSLFAITVVCGLFVPSASAQFSSSSRTGSTTGTAFSSSSSAGSTSGFGSTASPSGASTSGFGSTGASSGFGNTGANRTGAAGQTQFAPAQLNQNNPNGFIGGRNQQQQFIGGTQRAGQNAIRQQGGQNQFGNQRQSRQNQNDSNGMNQQGQTTNNRRAVRPQQKVAFEVPRRTETEIRTTLQTRFDVLSQNPKLQSVTFDMDSEGVVTLRGEVETTAARQLAANVVRLEPGVRKVVNELTVP